MNTDPAPRHHLFEVARRRAELTVPDLWLRYLAIYGSCDVFDVDAYLHGLGPLTTLEQDVLALALNERLDDLYREARVPYLTLTDESPTTQDPLVLIEELLYGPPAPSDPPHTTPDEPAAE